MDALSEQAAEQQSERIVEALASVGALMESPLGKFVKMGVAIGMARAVFWVRMHGHTEIGEALFTFCERELEEDLTEKEPPP